MAMATPFSFRAVIFDMDGLLLDSEPIAQDAWHRAAKLWGFDIPADLYSQVIGRHTRDTERIFKTFLGADFPFHEIRQHRLKYADDYITKHGLPIKPGVIELLTMLQEQAVPRAVATSTEREEALRRLHIAELSQYFDIFCGGDEVANGKPAPDLFLLAAERLRVDPGTCVVLEDSEFGVRAAKNAGMIPLLIPDLKPPSDEVKTLAYEVFPSLHEVKTIMMQVLQRRETA
jgi:HAD superfamily hydrolase (TIGR01509 family)